MRYKTVFFLGLFLLGIKNPHGKVKDYFLIVPPLAKVSLGLIGEGVILNGLARGEVWTFKEASASLVLLSLGVLPNIMLVNAVIKKDAQKITFWRKYNSYQEGIIYGGFASLLIANYLNSNEDKYPESKSDDPSGEEGLVFSAIALFGGVVLLNLIPFSYEKITPHVSMNFIKNKKSARTPYSPKVALSLSYSF